MKIAAALPLSVVILNLFLLIFILSRPGEKNIKLSFALLSFCVMVWNSGYFLLNIVPTRELALISRQVNFFGAVFVPPSFLYFILALTGQDTTKRKIIFLAALVSSFTLFILNFKGFTTNEVV